MDVRCSVPGEFICPFLKEMMKDPVVVSTGQALMSEKMNAPAGWRHLDEKPQLVIIKRDSHAVNVEKPKQIYKHIKEFLVDPKQESKDDGNKVMDAKKPERNGVHNCVSYIYLLSEI
ncbi:hypothetical protein QQ045_023030 [Rhodiola kirilowii]